MFNFVINIFYTFKNELLDDLNIAKEIVTYHIDQTKEIY